MPENFRLLLKRKKISSPQQPAKLPKKWAANRVIIWVVSLLAAISSLAFLLNLFLNQSTEAKQLEAKTYVGAMNRAQQAYFLENSTFGSTLEQLQIGIASETENYSYGITVIDPNRSVKLTGTSKQQGLKSYTGAVFIVPIGTNSELISKAILCESNQPSQIPPEMPNLVGENIECASGSSPPFLPTP